MVSETSPRYRPDILERAKAVDPEMLAVLNWGALRDLISELIAEVEAKQANNEYLQKMTEEAQGIMQESQLLLCKEANEAEQLQNEVERLRSLNESLMENGNDLRTRCQKAEARIKELEALNELNHKNMRSWLDTTTDKEFLDKLSSEIGFKDAYIKRLEAAFLEATKEIVYATHEGRDAPEGEDVYAEKVAREALEQLRAEGKIGGGDGE